MLGKLEGTEKASGTKSEAREGVFRMKIEMTVEEFKELMNVTKKTDDRGNRFEFESDNIYLNKPTLKEILEELQTLELPENSTVKMQYSRIL